MTNDVKIKNAVKALAGHAIAWVEMVDELGNQDAKSDRCLEGLLKEMETIKELYAGNKIEG